MKLGLFGFVFSPRLSLISLVFTFNQRAYVNLAILKLALFFQIPFAISLGDGKAHALRGASHPKGAVRITNKLGSLGDKLFCIIKVNYTL